MKAKPLVTVILIFIMIGFGVYLLFQTVLIVKTSGTQEPTIVLNPGDPVEFDSKNQTTAIDAVVYPGENISFVGNHWSPTNDITCLLGTNVTTFERMTTQASKSGQFVDYLIIPQVSGAAIMSLKCQQNSKTPSQEQVYSPTIFMGIAGEGNVTNVGPDADGD